MFVVSVVFDCLKLTLSHLAHISIRDLTLELKSEIVAFRIEELLWGARLA